MRRQGDAAVRREIRALIETAGVVCTDADWEKLVISDFGLGDVRLEGVQYIDLFRTDRLRLAILALLPGQTLPQHCHPPYDGTPGKEENIRCLSGEMRVYLPGRPTRRQIAVPAGKEAWYTVRRERVLRPGESITIAPGVDHWFQAGPGGCVTLSAYPAADDSRNVFTDPGVTTVGTVRLRR